MHDAHRNEKYHFYLFGKFVAIGLLQGVPGLHCFCKPLVEYILSDDVTASTITVQLTDVPVFEVKEKLEAISNAQSKEELASCLKDFEERFVSGYNKFLIKLSDKADLLQKVSRYYVITRQLEAIQQFTSRLSSYSLPSSLRKFKAQAEKEFIYSPCPITSKYLQDLYTFEFTVTRDEILKQKEKNIAYNWCNFLDEIECCMVERKTVISVHGEAKKEVTLDFEDLLFFLTGSWYLVTVGAITGKLNFKHQNIKERERVTVSTCAYGLLFPVTRKYTGEHFMENIVDGILNSPGFGKVRVATILDNV